MCVSEQKALEITTQIVLAQIQNSQPALVNETSGKAISDYFKAVFAGVKDITVNIKD